MNRSKPMAWAAALLLAAALALVACESTDLTAPSDGTMLLNANPGTIVFDPNLGQTSGTSTITATVFNGAGQAVQGVVVQFFTTGGTLKPISSKTNAAGAAQTTLTMTRNDPDPVEVTARSASLSEAISVTRDSVSVNKQPAALIVAVPAPPPGGQAQGGQCGNGDQGGQLAGQNVSFDGTVSADPDGDAITCYQWTIDSDIDANDEMIQGTGAAALDRTYADPQCINVTLRVSDDPAIGALCDGAILSENQFSPTLNKIAQYPIRCDNPPPVAVAPADIRVPIPSAQNVFLDGTASYDNETPIDRYLWSCGSQSRPQPSASAPQVFCTYTAIGVYEATLQVWDRGDGTIGPNGTFRCQKTAIDKVVVDVFNPNAP